MSEASMHHLVSEVAIPAGVLLCASIGAFFDVKSRRIPNLLTGPAMLIGLGLHGAAGGWTEMFSALGALLLTGAVFLIFYLAGGMGAGDVKMIAAEGCLLGLASTPALLTLTALCGGVLALLYAVRHKRFLQTWRNVMALVAHHHQEGLTPHPELHVGNVRTVRLPYGLAIAVGSILTLSLRVWQVSL